MSTPKRIDDFRCFDPALVEILPGREMEAAQFAVEACRMGICAGIFVHGEAIENWDFLHLTKDIGRFEFVNPGKSLSKLDWALLSNAVVLRLVGRSLAVDFHKLPLLEQLYFHWNPRSVGLQSLSNLKRLDLFRVSVQSSAPVLPSQLETLKLAHFSQTSITSTHPLSNLQSLEIHSARKLNGLPELESLKELSLTYVGEQFCYDTIPTSVRSLSFDSCAEIDNWDFAVRLEGLNYLNLYKTKHVPIPQSLIARLD